MRRTLLTIAAVLSTAPASAQPGPLVPRQTVLKDFAECTVRLAERRTRHVLTMPLDTKQERGALLTLAKGNANCLKDRTVLSFPTGAMRGALAEAALAKEPEVQAAAERLTPSRPERPKEADGRKFLIAYSGCLVASDPEHARGLLRTAIRTPEERTAFLAFGEALMGCMPLGLQFQANVTEVRNHIAAILYLKAAEAAGAVHAER